jgi:chlorite dismutase
MSWLSEALHQTSWSSAGGVLFGAGISAAVLYVLQRSSFAEARRQKEKDRLETRKAVGYALFFKMIRPFTPLVKLWAVSPMRRRQGSMLNHGKLSGRSCRFPIR